MHPLATVRSPALARLSPLAALVLVLAVAAAPRASAGTYTVFPCNSTSHPGLAITTGSDAIGFHGADHCGSSGEIDQSGGLVGSTDVKLSAPDGTTITSVDLTRDISGTIDPSQDTGALAWFVADERGDVGHLYDNVSPSDASIPEGPTTYSNPSPGASLNIVLRCFDGTHDPCTAQSLSVKLTDISATLDDSIAPTVDPIVGPDGPVRGTVLLPIVAHDRGAGILTYSIVVDDGTATIVHLSNDDECERPFTLLVPCATSAAITAPLDTTALLPSGTRLADGPHTVKVIITDAVGNSVTSNAFPLETLNAPLPAVLPAISGGAQVGRQATATPGTWLGAPTFAYQWVRCSGADRVAATIATCTPIAGATKPAYVLTTADLSHRVAVVVTATNFADTLRKISAPIGPVAPAPATPAPGTVPPGGHATTPPLLSAPSLSHSRFRAGTAGGSSLRLTSSEGGQLSIAIERARPGRKVRTGGKLVCVAVRRAARSSRCTLYARAGTFTRTIAAGHVSFALNGRIGSRKLAPGSYRLTLTERDAAGNVSKPLRLSFTILPG